MAASASSRSEVSVTAPPLVYPAAIATLLSVRGSKVAAIAPLTGMVPATVWPVESMIFHTITP